MDSFKFIIGILIAVGLSFIFDLKLPKRSASASTIGKKQAKATARPLNTSTLCRDSKPVLPDEGVRVTHNSPGDETSASTSDLDVPSTSALLNSDDDDTSRIQELRRAVILAEVLKTKF